MTPPLRNLIRLVEDAAAVGARGNLHGAGSTRGEHLFSELFRGREQAIVSLEGHASANLGLGGLDEQGNPVRSSAGVSSHESCSFAPEWTASYTITIIQVGRANQLGGTQYKPPV